MIKLKSSIDLIIIFTIVCGIVMVMIFLSDTLMKKRTVKEKIYSGVLSRVRRENTGFVEDFAFKRSYKKALKEYAIVTDFIMRSDGINDTLVDQVIDRVADLVMHRKEGI